MNSVIERRRVTAEFRSIFKAIDDLNRRSASTILNGRVAKIEGDYVRLELMPPDSRTGKPFLSPKVLVQEMAGRTGSRFPVKVGDPMRLLSPNGEIGPQSLAIRDAYTDDAPAPGDPDEFVIAHGGASIRIRYGALKIVATSVDVESDSLAHNSRNIGADHRHEDVTAGPDKTGYPE